MEERRLENAILRTVLYGDVFDFPMTVVEIHHFLIYDEAVSLGDVEQALVDSPYLQSILHFAGNYVVCAGHEAIITLRKERERAAQHLWPEALYYGRWLSRMPFIRMVALTGALAVRNTYPDDDLDYMLVTLPGRVWLARACAIILVRLGKLRGMTICPNYVVAQNALEQPRQDLFIAHELAQMVPLYGHAIYRQMRDVNLWSEAYLPNASSAFYSEPENPPGIGWKVIKRAVELVLSGRLGDALDSWEHKRKVRRFAVEMRTPNSSAQLDRTQVKGHFNDHGHLVMSKYEERLRSYGLIEIPAPGD